MTLVLVAVLATVAVAFLVFRKRKGGHAVAHETTPALDKWIAEALELELAEGALDLGGHTTPDERKRLAATLKGEPDAEVVSKIEDKVKTVELEFVRYAHEKDAEVAVRVRYENGKSGTSTRRMPWTDVPEAVRAEFDKNAGTRVFRTWHFPWQRVSSL
jgi:hypothetical protein